MSSFCEVNLSTFNSRSFIFIFAFSDFILEFDSKVIIVVDFFERYAKAVTGDRLTAVDNWSR